MSSDSPDRAAPTSGPSSGPLDPPGSGGITRRTFLRFGAGGLVLAVAGRWPLSGCSGEPIEPERDEPDPGPPYAAAVILAVPQLCGGCGRCALTCSALHGDGPGAAHALVGPDPVYGQVQFSHPYWYAATCHMCPRTQEGDELLTPDCVACCPRGAARIAEPGHPRYGDSRVRYIDPARCIGCGQCLSRCPYGHPLLEDGLARKCDLCLGRFPSPPCIEACPSRALRLVTPWAEQVADPFDWTEPSPAAAAAAALMATAGTARAGPRRSARGVR